MSTAGQKFMTELSTRTINAAAPSSSGTTTLLPCPFCGQELARKTGRINPLARCITEGCVVAAKMSVINLDDPVDVERWNTRAHAQTVPRETLAKTLYEFSIHENANLNLDLSPARPWADADQAYWLRAADAAELAQAETKPKWDNWPACSFPEMAAPAQRPADCDEIVNALRAIIVRCDEGDKKSDWLPIISSLAKSVLPKALALSSTDRAITRRSEADAYFKILQTIARFPITDPKNMDAVNMRLIAEGAIAIPSTKREAD